MRAIMVPTIVPPWSSYKLKPGWWRIAGGIGGGGPEAPVDMAMVDLVGDDTGIGW